MNRYKLDEKLLKKRVKALGFSSISQFTKRYGINRATLGNYIAGKGPLPESFYAIASALLVDPLSLLIPAPNEKTVSGIDEISHIIKYLCDQNSSIAVLLIGSRAKGGEEQYSDWDIAITGGTTPVSSAEYLRLKRTVDDLAEDLPRGIDLINLDAAPSWFLKKIDYAPILLGGNISSMSFFMGVLNGIQKAA